jgi:hypothetical protein
MRLLTHNQLVCVRKGCASHYPLQLRASAVEKSGDTSVDSDGEEEEQEVDTEEEVQAKLEFVLHLLPNVDYAVLCAAAASVSQQQQQQQSTHSDAKRSLHAETDGDACSASARKSPHSGGNHWCASGRPHQPRTVRTATAAHRTRPQATRCSPRRHSFPCFSPSPSSSPLSPYHSLV